MKVGIRYGSAVQKIKLITTTINRRIPTFFASLGNDFTPLLNEFLNHKNKVSASSSFTLKNVGGETGSAFGGNDGIFGRNGVITLIICPPFLILL
jgi:hypothetical protein